MPGTDRHDARTAEIPSVRRVLAFIDTLNERGATPAALRAFTHEPAVLASLLTLDGAVPNFHLHVTAARPSGDMVVVHARIQGVRARPRSAQVPARVDLPASAELEVSGGRVVRLTWHVDPTELRSQTGLDGLSAQGARVRPQPPPSRFLSTR